jgi:preprotein translocase subunit SecG
MYTAFLVIHLIVSVVVIGLVLVQHGKGADMGAAFGSGSAGSLFGASGSANFLSRTTGILAAVFFMTSLGLTYFSYANSKKGGLMEKYKLEQKVNPAIPAAPAKTDAPTQAPADSKAKDIPK